MAKYGKLTWGQIEALINRLGGEEAVHEILSLKGTANFTLPSFLIQSETLAVGPLTASFDPRYSFQTIDDIWISPEFVAIALSVAKVVEEAEEEILKVWNITRDANDFGIRAELPEDHFVELWQIAELIERQWVGQDGPLLTNGRANLFYLKGEHDEEFVVRVRRSRRNDQSNGRRWRWSVCAWWLGGSGTWPAGGRIFACVPSVRSNS